MSDTQPAKPVSDVAEIVRKLRRYPAIRKNAWKLYDEGYCYDDEQDNAPIEELVLEAADTIEALQRENERLAKALTYISWVGPALVAPGGVLWIRQDSVDALLLDAGIMPHRPLTGESEDDYYRRVRGEGDQLQGGSDK